MQQHPVRRRRAVTVLVCLGATLALTLSAGPAWAVPDPPPNPSDSDIDAATAQQQAAAAEVGRIAGLVADAATQLEQAQLQAEAAGTALLGAQEQLQLAQDEADRTAAASAAADAAVEVSRQQIAAFSRTSYISGGSLSSSLALLDADGPTELLEQAAMLDYVADRRVDVLDALEVAQAQQAAADAAAQAARDQQAAAEAAAEAAQQAADAQVAAQQATVAQVAAQQADLQTQLQNAQVALLQLQGARDAYGQWLAQRQAEEAAAGAAEAAEQQQAATAAAAAREAGPEAGSADYVKPASGRVSSCYGSRWGTSHLGVDIAAPIGTPIWAATSGTVLRAGPATGFGLAVYIRGDDGAVTVYGHMNSYFVSVGDRVSAGEEIAEVGNRGESTGPHLHFEVHPNGAMYSGAVDPVPWMNARGITMGGCGG